MGKIITDSGRKAIKKMAEISQVARVLNLVPKPEDFALKLISDLKNIVGMVKSVSLRIDQILDMYSSIPSEFLLKGFDEILDKLNDINDYAKFAIAETANVMSSTVKSAQELTDAVNLATSTITSAALQIGGGLTYGTVAMGANILLAMNGNGRRSMTNDVVQDVIDGKVSVGEMEEEFEKRINENSTVTINGNDYNLNNIANEIGDWTKTSVEQTTESIDNFFDKADVGFDNSFEWIEDKKENADEFVDNTVGKLIEKVENAKKTVEDKIEQVRRVFDNFIKKFDDAFGFVSGKDFVAESFENASNTAFEKMDTPVYDALGEVTGEIADFIKNFSIGKVVTAIGGIVIGAGAATLAMDLLPNVNVDRMLRDIMGGVDTDYSMDKMSELYYNKYYEDEPDGIIPLSDVPDSIWKVSEDDLTDEQINLLNSYKEDLEIYTNNEYLYTQYLDEHSDDHYASKTEMLKYAQTLEDYNNNRDELIKTKKSALKEMRKIRRNVIKAKQIEKYKGFLKIELNYLEREFNNLKNNINNEWNSMMSQYKIAINEIKAFFSKEGCGGTEAVDRCCDRINNDAEEITDLCKNIKVELTNSVSNIAIPYAIGTCFDMPVHKILEFFKDLKIIITFLKNLIRLGVDIISQLSILAKIISNGMQSLVEIMDTLKKIIGIDKIFNMIDYLVALFRPKMIDAKKLLENSLSPIYYNETEDYEMRVDAMEALLDDESDDGGYVKQFKSTDDIYAKNIDTFGGKGDDKDIEEWLEELEAKGEREIVAYRSPILNAEGDDFAGWIFYHAHAYDNMNTKWKDRKKRRRNKLIKKASKKNKLSVGRLVGGVSRLKNDTSFGYYNNNKYINNSVSGFDAYYWYTKWTSDPTDCEPDFTNMEIIYDDNGNPSINTEFKSNVVSPVQTTANGSLVEIEGGQRVFVEGQIVKSGDFVNVNGKKYKVK